MKLTFVGATHLGSTLAEAARIRGFETASDLADGEVIFVTPDVQDHNYLGKVEEYMTWAARLPTSAPIVLVSQVPPGYTRKWLGCIPEGRLYYQVDTIIMNCALLRATFPERFVVGSAAGRGVSAAYWDYLRAFDCSAIEMSYESAEMVKLAVNYYLAKQIEATNDLFRAAQFAGADWASVERGVRGDKRIGAYTQPGNPNDHLLRDVRTIERFLHAQNGGRGEYGRVSFTVA